MSDTRKRGGRILTRRFDKSLSRDLLADQLDIEPLPAGKERRQLRWAAWTLIGLTFIVGWGLGTIGAITTLLNNGHYDRQTYALLDYLITIPFDAIVLLLAIAGIIVFSSLGKPHRVPWQTSTRTFFVYSLIPALAFLCAAGTADFLGIDRYNHPEPYYPHDWLHLVDALDSAMAGPTEELALLALPVIALRRVGYSWTTICITAACLRVPFHVYYGWVIMIFVAIWAIAAVLLYRRTRAITAIILAHAAHNIFIALDPLAPGIYLTNLGLCILGVVVIVLYLFRQRDRAITAYRRV